MRFLADESCDFAVVKALRAPGHDVTAVVEISLRAKDPAVLALARSEARVLLTEDKDFGLLAFAGGLRPRAFFSFAFQTMPEAVSGRRCRVSSRISAIGSREHSW